MDNLSDNLYSIGIILFNYKFRLLRLKRPDSRRISSKIHRRKTEEEIAFRKEISHREVFRFLWHKNYLPSADERRVIRQVGCSSFGFSVDKDSKGNFFFDVVGVSKDGTAGKTGSSSSAAGSDLAGAIFSAVGS